MFYGKLNIIVLAVVEEKGAFIIVDLLESVLISLI
jgi:hypothetical protein